MGYDRAFSALHLEEADRVAQVEFLSNTEFIAEVSGLNPMLSPEEARSRAYSMLDIDMIWFTYNPLDPWGFLKNKEGFFEVRGDSWSKAYPTTWRKIFNNVKSVEEIYSFNPFESWNVPSVQEIAKRIYEEYNRVRLNYSGLLIPGGTYHTCLMWLIKAFGLEWTVKAAYRDPKAFKRVLDLFGEISLLEAKAWAQTNIEAFISHDDICSTRGPFFPISWMRKYLFPWYKRIWHELKSRGIIVLFCTDGDMTSIVDDIAESGADGFIIEECCNLKSIADKYGNEKVIIGGVDIGILTYGTVQDVIGEVKRCLETAGAYPGYFINVSGSIPDNVPLKNLEAYFKAARKYGRRPIRLSKP